MKPILVGTLGLAVFFATEVMAADFASEVMSVQGNVYVSSAQGERHEVKRGDLLQQGDLIETEKNSYVDIAYDSEWNNLSRIKEDSRVVIQSVFPTTLDMTQGSIFSRLNQLPKNSTFMIQTPSAVASVRGTIFEASERNGQMDVRNFSEGIESKIYVNVLDELGRRGSEIVVPISEKLTGIAPGLSDTAAVPQRMTNEEIDLGRSLTTNMTVMVTTLESGGHVSNIQSLKEMETYAADPSNFPGANDNNRPGVGGPPNGPGDGGADMGTRADDPMGGAGHFTAANDPLTRTFPAESTAQDFDAKNFDRPELDRPVDAPNLGNVLPPATQNFTAPAFTAPVVVPEIKSPSFTPPSFTPPTVPAAGDMAAHAAAQAAAHAATQASQIAGQTAGQTAAQAAAQAAQNAGQTAGQAANQAAAYAAAQAQAQAQAAAKAAANDAAEHAACVAGHTCT